MNSRNQLNFSLFVAEIIQIMTETIYSSKPAKQDQYSVQTHHWTEWFQPLTDQAKTNPTWHNDTNAKTSIITNNNKK